MRVTEQKDGRKVKNTSWDGQWELTMSWDGQWELNTFWDGQWKLNTSWDGQRKLTPAKRQGVKVLFKVVPIYFTHVGDLRTSVSMYYMCGWCSVRSEEGTGSTDAM